MSTADDNNVKTHTVSTLEYEIHKSKKHTKQGRGKILAQQFC